MMKRKGQTTLSHIFTIICLRKIITLNIESKHGSHHTGHTACPSAGPRQNTCLNCDAGPLGPRECSPL